MCRPRLLEFAAAVLVVASACAKPRPPDPEVVRRAALMTSYSGSLRVSLKGEDLRGRTRALVAFRRPAALRIEIPGPAGARLVAVARDGSLTAILPGERAVLESEATATALRGLLGIALSPDELMDVLVGIAPKALRGYQARWGRTLPRRVVAWLADGTRLTVEVEAAEDGEALPAAAFAPPPHEGWRPIDADEARRLLGGR